MLAARACGADFAYIGSPFIATTEANATEAYKQVSCRDVDQLILTWRWYAPVIYSRPQTQAIVDGTAADVVYSNLFTGVHGNYLRASIEAAGLDPDNLPASDPTAMNFGSSDGFGAADSKKAWRDIWGCGQGIGTIDAVVPVNSLVDRLTREYEAARSRL